MALILNVQAYRGAAPMLPLGHRFDGAGGVIGRAPGSHLVLPDPTKAISRAHARVEFRAGAWYLVDLGGNPSIVDGVPLAGTKEARLQGGERIVIGDYVLLATAEPDARPPAQPHAPSHDATLTRPMLPQACWPAEDSLAAASILDVSGPFLPGADPAGDPLGLKPRPHAAGRAGQAAESDHVSPERAAFPVAPVAAPAPVAIPDGYDPLSGFLPPRVAREPDAPPPPAAAALPATPATPDRLDTTAAADGAVLRALLRGMGLPELNSRHGAEALAELAGSMLREATAGTMAALMARALTKRESRLDVTMIARQANNPLKFFPDAAGALTQMLQDTTPGYMEPRRAFASAFDDLRSHELAIMAGMRAALSGVLRRFDPEAIEARLQVPTVVDKMLVANRKAKMWDRMVELYGSMAAEADEDFQRLFGAAFAAAYEEQVRRLHDAGR